jgi:hypothetical protein
VGVGVSGSVSRDRYGGDATRGQRECLYAEEEEREVAGGRRCMCSLACEKAERSHPDPVRIGCWNKKSLSGLQLGEHRRSDWKVFPRSPATESLACFSVHS